MDFWVRVPVSDLILLQFTVKNSIVENGIGIPGFGENPEISLTTDALLNGSPFVTAGPKLGLRTKDLVCRLNLIPLLPTLILAAGRQVKH